MSNRVSEEKVSAGAEPGQVGASIQDVRRAQNVSDRARQAASAEESRLSDRPADPEQARRLDEARQDLDAAEAFEEAVESSQL